MEDGGTPPPSPGTTVGGPPATPAAPGAPGAPGVSAVTAAPGAFAVPASLAPAAPGVSAAPDAPATSVASVGPAVAPPDGSVPDGEALHLVEVTSPAAAADRAAVAAAAKALVNSPESWSHRERARIEERLADLPRTPWGRRGYDESAVDALLAGVSNDLVEADDQIDDLRSEVDRLHRYIRRQWAAVAAAEAAGRPRGRHAVDAPDESASPRAGAHGAGPTPSGGQPVQPVQPVASPTAQARAVLTQAQEIAERRLAQADARLAEAERIAAARLAGADAVARVTLAEAEVMAAERIAAADEASGHRLARTERMAEQVLTEAADESNTRRARAVDDARRLLVLARARYEDIIVRAHQRADHAAELALDDLEPVDGEAEQDDRERRELEIKAAYLRMFAKVSRTALQAALDLSGREFDQLLGDSATLEESLATQDRTQDDTEDDASDEEDDVDVTLDQGEGAKVIVLPRSGQSRPAALSAK